MAELIATQCCGIRELNEVMDSSSAREVVVDAAEDWFENDKDGAFLFFSVTSDSRMGHNIARYITKYELGIVHKTHSMRNPNSDNMLTMWVWEVNKQNFQRYWHTTNRYKKQYKD